MTTRALLLASMLALLAAACQTPRHDAGAIPDDEVARVVEQEVRATLADFLAAETTRDPEVVLAFVAPDFHMLQDGLRVDRASTVEQMRSTLPGLRAFEPRFDDIRVIPLGRDWALSSLVFHDRIVAADGGELTMWGPSTMLWRRDAEGWRLVFADSDHYPEP